MEKNLVLKTLKLYVKKNIHMILIKGHNCKLNVEESNNHRFNIINKHYTDEMDMVLNYEGKQ
jgi:RNase P/RNase MRP subunit p30